MHHQLLIMNLSMPDLFTVSFATSARLAVAAGTSSCSGLVYLCRAKLPTCRFIQPQASTRAHTHEAAAAAAAGCLPKMPSRLLHLLVVFGFGLVRRAVAFAHCSTNTAQTID
jgi:hypothetical protein